MRQVDLDPAGLYRVRCAECAANPALTFADGMAVRVPNPTALEVIRKGAERIVQVSDDEMPEAIWSIYSANHNCAEGAGAAALAALSKEHRVVA